MYKIIHSLFFLTLISFTYSINGDDKANLRKIIDKYSELSKDFKAQGISVQAFLKIAKSEDLLFIDVRNNNEQAISTLPNSITQSEFLKNPSQYKHKKLVAFCTIGYRSGLFCEKYSKWNILNLEGGLLAWSHFKGSFIRNGKETKKVHVYSAEWNFLHSNYTAVYK